MIQDQIVVTGMGAITPIGIGVPAYWQNLIDGVCGVSQITRFDPSDLPVQIAAEVKDFHATDFLSKKLVRETDIFMHFALIAAQEALEDSKLLSSQTERIGIVMGTALNGISTITQTQEDYTAKPGFRVSPHFVPKVLGNIAASQIAIAHKLKGPSLTLNTACSSGIDAVGVANMLLKMGEADAVIVVGAESILSPLLISALAQARALCTRKEEPEKASRPFDLERNGFVIGEGGGAIILETASHAKKRGAAIHASLLGYSSNTDGYHVISPDPSGAGAIACMQGALDKAGLSVTDVDYINAHGTSTKLGDVVEVDAIKALFGDHAKQMPVSSTKGATGHLMGAGGLTETIACIQAIRTGMLPPTLNYETPDPACDLDVVPNRARAQTVRVAMSNAFGFGGQNASLLVGKYEG